MIQVSLLAQLRFVYLSYLSDDIIQSFANPPPKRPHREHVLVALLPRPQFG